MATRTHTTDRRTPASATPAPGRRTLFGTAAAALLTTPALAAVGASDADLIALCDQHVQNIAAVNAPDSPARLDDEHAIWRAYDTTYDAVRNSEPQTMAGVIAKARAARAEAFTPEGNDAEECNWAALVVRDLLRVVDGGVA